MEKKKGKNQPRGIAKASQIQARRPNRAKSADARKNAKQKYRPTDEGIKKWGKHKDRSDMKGIDTKKRKKTK